MQANASVPAGSVLEDIENILESSLNGNLNDAIEISHHDAMETEEHSSTHHGSILPLPDNLDENDQTHDNTTEQTVGTTYPTSVFVSPLESESTTTAKSTTTPFLSPSTESTSALSESTVVLSESTSVLSETTTKLKTTTSISSSTETSSTRVNTKHLSKIGLSERREKRNLSFRIKDSDFKKKGFMEELFRNFVHYKFYLNHEVKN